MSYPLYIVNTYTKKKEEFSPLHPDKVTMYTCGPTVYDYAHIGNMRAFIFADFLKEVLRLHGYSVHHVMNITDVGHLTSDSDEGEDKVELQSQKEQRSAWDLVKHYTAQFFIDAKNLNIDVPDITPRATEHIADQIALIQVLEARGYTYKTSDGIYFDTSKFSSYGVMANIKNQSLKGGARVILSNEKKNITDFALWKFSPHDKKRQMEWNSPWGVGFPGWHIECSAMAMRYLGETIDIHTGGIDHITVHHTNEIAQSEVATGKSFVRYWMHAAFLLVDGQKMSKSLQNIITLKDIIERGYDPLAFRYLILTAKYNTTLNFTWKSLEASNQALNMIRSKMKSFPGGGVVIEEEMRTFREHLFNDLDTPQGLAVVHRVLKGDYTSAQKKATIAAFDKILKLNLVSEHNDSVSTQELPLNVKTLLQKRTILRREKKWNEADSVRNEIEKQGYTIIDTPDGVEIKKILIKE